MMGSLACKGCVSLSHGTSIYVLSEGRGVFNCTSLHLETEGETWSHTTLASILAVRLFFSLINRSPTRPQTYRPSGQTSVTLLNVNMLLNVTSDNLSRQMPQIPKLPIATPSKLWIQMSILGEWSGGVGLLPLGLHPFGLVPISSEVTTVCPKLLKFRN